MERRIKLKPLQGSLRGCSFSGRRRKTNLHTEFLAALRMAFEKKRVMKKVNNSARPFAKTIEYIFCFNLSLY